MNAGSPPEPHEESASRRSVRIAQDEFELIREYIEQHCGVSLRDDKTYLVETRLTEILGEQGCRTFQDLYRKARADRTNALRDKIIDAITTRETYWFRDEIPFAILRDEFLPRLAAEFAQGRRARVRVWCAACATGQEPYSVAMTILERWRRSQGVRPEQCEIVATDIAPSAIFLARAARYSAVDMSRGLAQDLRDRYFKLSGTVWTLNESVKAMVTFVRHNLQDPFVSMGPFDIIFCRNVLIYFADGLKRTVLEGFHQTLRTGGALVLGAAESVSRYSTKFEFVRCGNGMYYRSR